MNPTSIVEVRAEPWNVALSEPFGIATGAQTVAANVLVEIRLADGSRGLGEAAPFGAVNGETQGQALEAMARAQSALAGEDATRWRHLAGLIAEVAGVAPSARAGLEAALLDAVTRRAGLSLQRWFGGREEALETDLTIVTGTAERARSAAERAVRAGFRTLKIKVGGATLEHDLERVSAVCAAAPSARIVLDANAALSVDEAVELVRRVGRERVALFEQPVAARDLDGMRQVRERARVLVAADESARSAADVGALAKQAAADVVNIKIMKTGIAEACDMIAAARSFGMKLMIGGMVETPLAMTVSACLAAGQGGFDFVDLDTPLFMRDLPTRGGWRQQGPNIELSQITAGHGVEVTRGP